MTGQELQYDLHICLEFGQYVYERTIGSVFLGPTGNNQGGHWFMSFGTGS